MFVVTSKNGRYNYPNLKDSHQLQELVKQLQDTLGKDIVTKNVTINNKSIAALRKSNSNVRLPSLKVQLWLDWVTIILLIDSWVEKI